MSFAYFLLGLVFLLFTQRYLSKLISKLIHRLGGGNKAYVWFWGFIFLPGTIIHEVSHFLVAMAVGVPTGDIKIFPEFIRDTVDESTKEVKLGSVKVGRMNPIQGFLIGLAPFITGIAILLWLSTLIGPAYREKNTVMFFVEIYAFFTVANSFFPSWQDIKHSLPFVLLLGLILVGAYYLGLQIKFVPAQTSEKIFTTISYVLFASAFLNILISLPLKIIDNIARKRS